MKRNLLLIFALLSISAISFAYPWGHRYSAEQANQDITINVGVAFTVSVEWGEGGWDSSDFGYGLSTDGSDWTWVDIPWFEDDGSNKRCKTDVTINIPGKYYYAYRMVKGGTPSYSLGSDGWLENVATLAATSFIAVGDFTISDGNWSTDAIWNSGTAPADGSDVGIYNDVTLDSDVSVSNLAVVTGKTFSVDAGASIITTGNLVNNGSVNLLSSGFSKFLPPAPPTGSLIVDGEISGSGDFTIQRYIASHADASDEGWHLLSLPVDNLAIVSSQFKPTSDEDDLFMWDEASSTWFNYFETTFSTFDKGIGYLCAYKNSATKSFSGDIVNSDVSHLNLNYSAGGIDDNWHLLGNPFTSALDISAGTWNSSNVSTPQVYDEASKGYFAVNAIGNIIPAMQGFFVQTTNATNSITIPKDARVHSLTNWYKDANENSNTIKLQLVGSEIDSKDLLMVGFDDNSSEAYDIEFDSHKLFSLANVPQFFMLNETGEQFSVNYLANDGNEKMIPLHIRIPAEGTYTISIAENELEANSKVYLEDKLLNQQVELIGDNSYTFVASNEDNEDRFVLYFNKATGINELAKDNLQSYISDQNLYILGESGKAQLEVFDIQGKQLVSEQIVLDENYKKALSLPSGIYVVRIQNNTFVKSNKVIIK